jgi:hypothetical protein
MRSPFIPAPFAMQVPEIVEPQCANFPDGATSNKSMNLFCRTAESVCETSEQHQPGLDPCLDHSQHIGLVHGKGLLAQHMLPVFRRLQITLAR